MANTTKKTEKPEIGLFGLSNQGGIEILDPNKMVQEPLDKIAGSSYSVPGIDGRGKEGKVSAVAGKDLYGELSHVGETVKVTKKIATLKSVIIPSLDNENERYLLVFDRRRHTEKNQTPPLKIYKQDMEQKVDRNGQTYMGVKNMTLLPNSDEGIVIKESTLNAEDVKKAVEFAVSLIKSENITMSAGFKNEYSNDPVIKNKSNGVISNLRFLSIFDRYFKRTEENLDAMVKIKRALGAKGKFNGVDSFEEDLGSISKAFDLINLDTIKIKSLEDVRDNIKKLKDNDLSEREQKRLDDPTEPIDFVRKRRQEFLQELGDSFDVSINNTSTEMMGYDNTGNLIFMANHGLLTKSNGAVYSKDEGNMGAVLKDVRENFNKIKKLFTGGKYTPSDEDVEQAVSFFVEEGKKVAGNFFPEQSIALPNNVAQIKGKLLGSDDKEKNFAFYQIKQLDSFVRKARNREFLLNFDTSSNDFLVKDKKRQRNVSYGTKEKEKIYDELMLAENDRYEVIAINAKLPSLTFPVDGNAINFKEYAAPIVNVYRSTETSNVLELRSAANIAQWKKGDGRLGSILAALAIIDPADEKKANQSMSSLINYGITNSRTKKSTNFGLLGIMSDNDKVKDRLGSYLNELYNTFKDKGLVAGQELIKSYSSSDNPTLKTLGAYVESTMRHVERNRSLTAISFAVKGRETTDLIIKKLNGEKVDLPEGLSAKKVYDVRTTSAIIEKELNVLDAVWENKALKELDKDSALGKSLKRNATLSPVESAAKDIGYAIASTTLSTLAFRGTDPERSTEQKRVTTLYIDNSIHKYPSGVAINPYIKNAWNADKKEWEVQFDVEKLKAQVSNSSLDEIRAKFDISDELKEIKAEYITQLEQEYATNAPRSTAIETMLLDNDNLKDDSVSFNLAELMDMSEKIEETEEGQAKATSLSELMSSDEQEESDVKTEAMLKEEEDLLAEILNSEDITEAEVNQIIDEELYGDITLEDLDSVVFDDEPREDIGKKAKNMEKKTLKLDKNL